MRGTGMGYDTEHASSGVFNCLYDEHFTLLESPDNLCQFLGYTPQEMESHFQNHMLEFIHPDDRNQIKEKIASRLSNNNVFMFENRLITKSGDVRWIWISAELRKDALLRQYFHCIFHDISDDKKSQEALALSERRYEIVLSQMQDIIFELDCRTFDIYYSPNFEKKFGYPIPVKGFPDSMFATDIIFEADKEPLRQKFQSLLKGNDQMHHEYRLKCSDGHYIWVDVHATTMKDSNGNLLKILGIISDIDERKTEIIETRKIARMDPLTGLLNRRECIRRIHQYMKDSDELAAFFLIDIDNFKKLNDSMGHLYGDAVLKDIARKLLAMFRKDDIIARIGGDEFVVFLPGISKKTDVFPRLEAIRGLFSDLVTSPETPSISSSIGVCFYPEHGSDFNTLFAKADASMYYSKKHGKNSYSFYENDSASAPGVPLNMQPLLARQKSFPEEIAEYLFQIFLRDSDSRSTAPELLGFLGHSFCADRIYICKKTLNGYFEILNHWHSADTPPMTDTLAELNSLDWKLSPELPILTYQFNKDTPAPKTRAWFENRNVKAAFLCWLGNSEQPFHLIGIENCHDNHPEVKDIQYSLFMVCQLLNLFLIKNLL